MTSLIQDQCLSRISSNGLMAKTQGTPIRPDRNQGRLGNQMSPHPGLEPRPLAATGAKTKRPSFQQQGLPLGMIISIAKEPSLAHLIVIFMVSSLYVSTRMLTKMIGQVFGKLFQPYQLTEQGSVCP